MRQTLISLSIKLRIILHSYFCPMSIHSLTLKCFTLLFLLSKFVNWVTTFKAGYLQMQSWFVSLVLGFCFVTRIPVRPPLEIERAFRLGLFLFLEDLC